MKLDSQTHQMRTHLAVDEAPHNMTATWCLDQSQTLATWHTGDSQWFYTDNT